MTNIEVAGITAGLGALGFTKHIRRISEMGGVMNPKMQAMQQAMKVAKAKGIQPKQALKSLKGKV
jgi:hypothetical protein